MLLFASIADASHPHPEVTVDDSLLLGTAQGSKEAFSELYHRCAQAVYAYGLSILRDPTQAEDVMQDTFLRIRSAAHLYEPQGKAMAWILTITRNLCLMQLRQNTHLSPFPLEEAVQDVSLSQIPDLEDRLVLQAALKILSEEEAQIIILHAVTGWKHREIARMLRLPLSTVLSKYHRGLKKLKEELEGKL